MKCIDETKFVDICANSCSMAQASRKLNMHFNTFRKYAIKLGCYKPNQSGKGTKKCSRRRISTESILSGNQPQFQTYKLKIRLIKEGYKSDKCEICGWDKKRSGDEFTPCELHHLNGDSSDHRLSNLQMLCPNCHSLTDSYRAKNISKNINNNGAEN